MVSHLVSLLLVFTTLASAWLPLENEDRDVFTFNASLVRRGDDSHSSDSTAEWLPPSGKIRGVNVGSLFVIEPWMARTTFNNMGCRGLKSEFDCVSKLGQSQADTVFQHHWDTWITQDDIRTMAEYGLNTIRISVGYWILEDIVDRDYEYFPRGGLQYLDRIMGWASDQGLYIILALHADVSIYNRIQSEVLD
ncbi:glycoside hydrolase [Pseudovirgaria hyperparasitica]|uniref:glucan endo-1,6-beta-glucosidase n=1 Tax=Pseudovirgaria hyperparasitica TaxID=470096 RepID=A0A6A6W604_9PEZI|nr:glycoside hydrolase [Pseudovirgaria hyperparasitica]KAF2756977.1 glycoside hydrolase [Pseudovirgaria hyperparasitica]